MVISFTPSTTTALAMARDYALGELRLQVTARAQGTVMLGSLPVLVLDKAIQSQPLLVGADTDRSLCKCPSWSS